MGNDEIVRKINAITNFYQRSSNAPRWSRIRKRITKTKANAFFVGVMLDQNQPADRAWDAAEYLVNNYFNETDDFWGEIANTHLATIRTICRTGYEGQAFAINFPTNLFPKWLKAAAKRIVSNYDSDVRNIWNGVKREDVDEIYRRFKEFEGIGDALAKMAQFTLVRSYGVAGGRASRKFMSVKPDVHLQRVLFRVGICNRETPSSVVADTDALDLRSPADFDWAVWRIGQLYCHSSYPECCDCPLKEVCDRQGLNS